VDLKEVGQLGATQEDHWYYASKARALIRSLGGREPRHVVDVGAGTGFFAKVLLRETAAERATCLDPGYPADWTEQCGSKSVAFRQHGSAEHADLILLMDVLEHVDDDVGLLEEHVRQAGSGTRFVISVPAFSWLWSQHDEFLEHRRRYTLAALRSVVRRAGLTPVGGFYFFGAILPAVAAQRLWGRMRTRQDTMPKSDLRSHHPATNRLLMSLCRAESLVARYNRAGGLTAFCVAEKR
jgi:SAM-dependent methyltransferase